MRDKLASVSDAVKDLIRNGDKVVMGACLEPNIPFAVTHEIIRQAKRDLEIIAPISDASTDMMIGAGCVGAISGAWVGNVSGGLGHNYRRAAEKQQPHAITINDYSNFSIAMALWAAAYGVPYVPIRSVLGSDIARSNKAFKAATNPLSGNNEPILLVPPLKPDVAVLPVQRADRFGNSHHWGNAGVAQEAALAADRVILLADEIVEPEVISSDPNRVLWPGFRVTAVCHVPAGVHPSPMTGCWRRDSAFFNDYHAQSRTPEGFQAWLKDWVFDAPDHAAYREKLGARLTELRIKGQHPSAPANFASE